MNIPKELLKVKKVTTKTTGLPEDNNHDPSNVIFHDGLYYFWYTHHIDGRPFDGFRDSKIMYMTSPDGINWSEGKDALLPSESGWDDCGVLTAFVVPHEDKFYLIYIGVDISYDSKENPKKGSGIAVSDSPNGPWERFGDKPIISPSESGWDSAGCDDVTILNKDGKWLLYYKGSEPHKEGVETKIGLATSDCITGPYTKYEGNPLIRGHAFSVWPYKNGFLYLAGLDDGDIDDDNTVGKYWQEGKRSLFWSEDGIDFEACCDFPNISSGLYTSTVCDDSQTDVTKFWGLMVKPKTIDHSRSRYIYRFDMVIEEE